jgi:hypothetical protein
MGMSEVKRAIEITRRHGGFFAGPRDESLVASAEAALGLRLPPTYRRFVSELGAGNAGGREFYGVTTDNFTTASIPNGIWLTLSEREQLGLPPEFVIVEETGTGEYYVLDTSRRDGDGESPVVVWVPGRPRDALEAVAPDFGSFFLAAVEDELGEL